MINKNSRKHRGRLSSKAALNEIIIDSQPYYYYGGDLDIIPFGLDNLYPQRMEQAIEDSPTAKGCVNRLKYFIKGHGFQGGDFQVNRHGETLNNILDLAIQEYVRFQAFALHFNFNLLGEIVEIFSIPLEYLRKNRMLDRVEMGIWDTKHQLYTNQFEVFDLYGTCDPRKKMRHGGYKTYTGQVYYFIRDGRIYPNSNMQTCALSAEYEREVQLYTFANVKNSFNASNIIKLPTASLGEKGQQGVDDLKEQIEKTHGAGNAGGSVVVPVTVNNEGAPSPFQMVEPLTHTSIDSLFTKQNENAERIILKTYMIPEILLGVSSKGMFNQAAYDDAFNYKIADTEQDRKIIEAEFNRVMDASIWGDDSHMLEITPLKMRKPQDQKMIQQSGDGDEKTSLDINIESQAALRGSVGGVQGILQIQQSVQEGTTDRNAALAILQKIYGFDEQTANDMLGTVTEEPEKENSSLAI